MGHFLEFTSKARNPLSASLALLGLGGHDHLPLSGGGRVAAVIAWGYWRAVIATYLWALAAQDRSGLAFLPFAALAVPWSILLYPVSSAIGNHAAAAVVYAGLCFLFSAVNSALLYALIARASVIMGKTIHRKG